MSEKRLKTVYINEENINDYFRGNMAVIEGLPDDATLSRVWEEPARHRFAFCFESEEFPVVEEGEEIPEEDIVIAERRVNNYNYWVCPNCTEVTESGDVVSGDVE